MRAASRKTGTSSTSASRAVANTVQGKASASNARSSETSREGQGAAARRTGAGEPLAADVRRAVEPLTGGSLDGVRLHTDAQSRQTPSARGADAATSGRDVTIQPELAGFDSPASRFAMAHELTHVVQQADGRAAPLAGEGGGAPAVRADLEGEADAVAERASGLPATSVRRKPTPEAAPASGDGAPVQFGFFDFVSDVASDIGSAVSSAAGTVADTVGGVVGGVSEAIGGAWDAATNFLGGAASWAWEGLKSLGSTAWNWLSRAGSAVWEAIKWLGSKAWAGIKWLGGFLWEKLALLGALAWSFISNLPIRLWRIVVHLWEGLTGVLGWLWTGLKGAAGAAWDAVVGVFGWLGSGLSGALSWLARGIASGAKWAWDFVQNPSLDKLWQGLLGTLSWVWGGITGFARWGWQGIVGAAVWAWRSLRGFASWLWDGIVGGLEWAGRLLLYVFELAGLGEILQLMWGLIFRMRRLTGAEIAASQQVHAAGMIPYSLVRVDDDSVLTWINGGRAVTTMHVLHYPSGGLPMHTVVHELTHVAQYEQVGAVYMAEALHAQFFGGGYNYGNLTAARAAGKRFKDFNREQQAQICEDYYLAVNGSATTYGATLAELQPYIDEMRTSGF